MPAREDLMCKTRDFIWLILQDGYYFPLILSLITFFLQCLSIQNEPWNEFMFYMHFSVNHEKGTFLSALSSSCYPETVFLIKFESLQEREINFTFLMPVHENLSINPPGEVRRRTKSPLLQVRGAGCERKMSWAVACHPRAFSLLMLFY